MIYRNLCTVFKLFNWSVHDYISGIEFVLRNVFSQPIIKADSQLMKASLLALCLNC